MTTVYSYYIGPVVGVMDTTLDATILSDLELPLLNYMGTVYNIGTECIDVTFSAALNQTQLFILNNLTDIILYGGNPSGWYIPNPNEQTRVTYRSASNPTVNNDYNDGYRNGSIITTTANDVFICTDNTVGAAVWIQLN